MRQEDKESVKSNGKTNSFIVVETRTKKRKTMAEEKEDLENQRQQKATKNF